MDLGCMVESLICRLVACIKLGCPIVSNEEVK